MSCGVPGFSYRKTIPLLVVSHCSLLPGLHVWWLVPRGGRGLLEQRALRRGDGHRHHGAPRAQRRGKAGLALRNQSWKLTHINWCEYTINVSTSQNNNDKAPAIIHLEIPSLTEQKLRNSGLLTLQDLLVQVDERGRTFGRAFSCWDS